MTNNMQTPPTNHSRIYDSIDINAENALPSVVHD